MPLCEIKYINLANNLILAKQLHHFLLTHLFGLFKLTVSDISGIKRNMLLLRMLCDDAGIQTKMKTK